MNFTAGVPEMTVYELSDLVEAGETPFLLDVRRPEEYKTANLGGMLIPLHELPHRLDELEPFKEQLIVVYCRSGVRSAQAVQYMLAFGFEQARNLQGGVLAWSRDIDPTMPTY